MTEFAGLLAGAHDHLTCLCAEPLEHQRSRPACFLCTACLPTPNIPPPILPRYDPKDRNPLSPPITPLRPPRGAPNVLVILLDDCGFGASSAFGGPCQTPTAERLAAGGLRYSRFHTTALCSPTRAAMLAGRNHHTGNIGGITEAATSAPGPTSVRPKTSAP